MKTPELFNETALNNIAAPAVWKDYLSLFKLRIVAVLVMLAIASASLANGALPGWKVLLPLTAAGLLASAGSSILNNCLDRDLDALMRRTSRRPLPQGRIKDSRKFILLGLGLIGLSIFFSLWLNLWVALCTTAGAFVYVVVYTWWLKRRSFWNIIIGGLAGSFASLAGGLAIFPQVTLSQMAMALLVFLWTPAHFWSFAILHHTDYRRAGVPMLPVVAGDNRASWHILLYTILLVTVAISLFFISRLGILYLAGILISGGLYLWLNFRLWKSPDLNKARSSYRFSMFYMMMLLLLITGDILI